MKISVNIYNTRLLLFSRRINSLRNIVEPIIREAYIIEDDNECLVSFDMTYFFELSMVFDEWSYYEPADEVEVNEYPKYLGMVGMVMKFFDLKSEEFISLFGYKEGISAQDLAFNIQEFVRKKLIK